MRGHDELVQARLDRWPVGGVDIVVGGLPGFDRRDAAVWFYLSAEPEEAETLDLRGCHGLPVFIHAPNYESGAALMLRAMEFNPLLVALCAPEILVRWDGGEIEEWAM